MTLNTAAQRTGQTLWGTPYGLYSQKEFGKLQIAFCLALLFHALPFGFLWHQGSTKKSLAVTTLQSVDFIEPESPKPVSEIPVFEKPKSALDFLKMALPIFRKSPQFESLKEVVISPKMRQAQPILDAPLIEKKLAIPIHAPEIKLDASRSSPLSKIMEIPKISPMEKGPVSALQDSAINLEEVGRRSVPSPSVPSPLKIQEPTLQDKGLAGRSPAPLPEIGNIPSSRSSGEVLMDASKPSPSRSQAIPTSLPGGEKSGRSGGFSLEGPRAYSYGGGKAEIKTALPAPAQPKPSSKIAISKEKVKISGPLSARKVVQSYLPVYPPWARAKNIEASVSIRFTVNPEGDVENALSIEKTSGYPELDRLAMETLKKWKFTALTSEQKQWGTITFKFLLD